jgi:hypothetical protein
MRDGVKQELRCVVRERKGRVGGKPEYLEQKSYLLESSILVATVRNKSQKAAPVHGSSQRQVPRTLLGDRRVRGKTNLARRSQAKCQLVSHEE